MQRGARPKDLGHEANRIAALNARLERRRITVTARLEHCALALFLEHGIDAVAVDDIAAAAGISRRTFYRYFESPIDIIRTVICRSMDKWTQEVRDRPPTEPILESFRAANTFTLSSPENAEPLRLALGVMRRSPEAWARISGSMQAHTTGAYRQIIAQRLAASGRATDMAGPIAAGLTAIFVYLSEQSVRENRALAPGEFEAALVEFQEMISRSHPR
jgi:AcrR family transcriptional regulator